MDFAYSGSTPICLTASKADIKGGKMNCYRWKIAGSEVPPTIDSVLNKFQPKKNKPNN